MNLAEARLAVRTATDLDATDETDSGVTGVQLNAWIDTEHKKWRRKLAHLAPSAFATTGINQALTVEPFTLTKPDDFDELIRVERFVNPRWFPIEASDELNIDSGPLAFREEAGGFVVGPRPYATGKTFRLIYVPKATDLTADDDEFETPDMFDDCITESVAARVRIRRDDDPNPHLALAKMCWDEQSRLYRRRHGKHGRPGLRIVRGL